MGKTCAKKSKRVRLLKLCTHPPIEPPGKKISAEISDVTAISK